MTAQTAQELKSNGRFRQWQKDMSARFQDVPLLAWFIGALVAVGLEYAVGRPFAQLLGMRKSPALFGFLFILKEPWLIPSAIVYVAVMYILPIAALAKATTAVANKAAAAMLRISTMLSVAVHLVLLYAVLHIWTDVLPYRLIVVKLTLIAIVITLSLNIVNGYMGEFSCSHPGFISLGAYGASVVTILIFDDPGPWLFPLALIVGGITASFGALLVAIPSFRTRGDYLAIISLAFTFIIKSFIENLDFVGGPRGLGGQPNWATLPVVFVVTITAIWVINNFVRSILGKALNAVRDNEAAADAMTVNTRRTKMTAFLFSAFWAGVAGGLLAHVLAFINPASFGLQKLAEVLAMVYFGGLNSVVGSIVGAVSLNLLGEMLRPLEIWKWIVIPLMLILMMIYRPTGLVAFKEFDIVALLQPKETTKGDQ
ncbi:MAG: branched-chain amino acid ABC transporter permease [Chloroflexi bacterium]|nr:branched-chain amino acid ABC transporter permease [Chloroflexota bacterium]